MHFEILVEDQSGKKMLEIILPKILGKIYEPHSWRIISYKGIGRLPENLKEVDDPSKRQLLSNLPAIMRGYGRSLVYGGTSLVIIVDNDRRSCVEFKNELISVLNTCNPKPITAFCLAIEEMEAWLLGDFNAVKKAYPKANSSVLYGYENDAICGTWEKLADAVYSGGSKNLSKKGYKTIGKEKSDWAEKITPHLDINNNKSKSFHYFVSKLRLLAS